MPAAQASTCQVCRGARWVCEDHASEPWPHEGCGGAGVPCMCNPAAAVEWREVFAEILPDGDRKPS
jgi:hypothetical protein